MLSFLLSSILECGSAKVKDAYSWCDVDSVQADWEGEADCSLLAALCLYLKGLEDMLGEEEIPPVVSSPLWPQSPEPP